MITLIIGHPDSGKSKLAEEMVTDMSAPGGRVYLATMIPYGEEGAARIEKHRKMREGKGFITIEEPFDVSDAFDRAVSDGAVRDPGSAAVLLECLSNLVANELFERHTDAEALTEKIADDILKLSEKAGDLVIVSNHFEVTEDFDEETRAYAELMDSVNDRISGIADDVIRI